MSERLNNPTQEVSDWLSNFGAALRQAQGGNFAGAVEMFRSEG